MVQRKITILEPAVQAVANISYFIEGKGLPDTAKKFVDSAFSFFEKLADPTILHRPCGYMPWRMLTYRCATSRKNTPWPTWNLIQRL